MQCSMWKPSQSSWQTCGPTRQKGGTPLHRAAAPRTQPGHGRPLTSVCCRVQPEMIAAYEEHVREIRTQLLPAALPYFAASGLLRAAIESGSQAAGSGLERCVSHVVSLYESCCWLCSWSVVCWVSLACPALQGPHWVPPERKLPPFCNKRAFLSPWDASCALQ